MEEWKWKKEIESENQTYFDTGNKAQEFKVTTTTYLLFDDGGVIRAQVSQSDNNNKFWNADMFGKDGKKTGEYIYPFRTAEDGMKDMWQRFEPEMLRNETGNHPEKKHKPI